MSRKWTRIVSRAVVIVLVLALLAGIILPLVAG